MQLTKNVLELVPGDVFYKGKTAITVQEIEAPAPHGMVIGDEVESVQCVAILLSTNYVTGWDHFPVDETVCMISPSHYADWKLKNNR